MAPAADAKTTSTNTKPKTTIKKNEVACDFTIIIDSREGLPYTFTQLHDGPPSKQKRLVVPVVRKSLETGDYSLLNYEELITIERKTPGDLYSSISQNRENFKDRLQRMEAFKFAAVVVEAGWDELLANPPPYTQYNPKSLARTIQSWMLRFKTHWIMVPGRAYGEAFTFRLLQRFWIHQQGAQLPGEEDDD